MSEGPDSGEGAGAVAAGWRHASGGHTIREQCERCVCVVCVCVVCVRGLAAVWTRMAAAGLPPKADGLAASGGGRVPLQAVTIWQ